MYVGMVPDKLHIRNQAWTIVLLRSLSLSKAIWLLYYNSHLYNNTVFFCFEVYMYAS